MKVLVIGSGGREHVIAKKLAESPKVEQVYAAPGNPGMQNAAECIDIKEEDHEGLIRFVKEKEMAFTVVGPEAPLLAGVVNHFEEAGLKVFGPTQEAALIEGSKSYAKSLMHRYEIPTGSYEVFSDYEEAAAYIEKKGVPIVIKADGLAAGKGVTVAFSKQEALAALRDILEDNKFGDAGSEVVLEEYLDGEELSLMAFVHGETVVPMVGAQDHKRAYNDDQGPNTGGMGAYSPVPQFTSDDIDRAVREVLQPAASGLVKEGRSFTGILYAGLMMTENGPKVIEFNARFGDPEAQVVLPRLKSDLSSVILELLNGGVPELEWSNDAVLGVVAASKGYPGSYEKYKPLNALPSSEHLYFAGVEKEGNQLLTAGGRVLLIAEKASKLKQARDTVYQKLEKLDTEYLFYRTDIGDKAIFRDNS
ncbi:phosphoribosylamine--glycine ligase [Alteribacillus bidgolensis]|uniref:Phosphoribosylamine--glycine ligase n=1 Tax=Alteribacillus bidgolensis TaxID=930129 RepID=A0A1G8KC06_9BACI|nr:phosphoribosylamine--glycine ligase [Alteribacillus bidgolensis]SDI40942.1 phosphoribosylamine--glycine ligase [Alteribacillus bidgolensis]